VHGLTRGSWLDAVGSGRPGRRVPDGTDPYARRATRIGHRGSNP